MSQTAKHLLHIYSARKKMQDEGVTNPCDYMKEVTSQLVMRLSEIDDSTEISIERNQGVTQFIVCSTKEVIAEIHPDKILNQED